MKLLIIPLAFLLCGCGSLSRSSLVSPSLDSIEGSVGRASDEIGKSEITATKVLKYGAMKDDPEVKAMVQSLKIAKIELVTAKGEIKVKQGEVDKMTEQSNKVIDRLNYLEPKYATAVGVLWKWRFIAIGSWLAFAGYMVAKFYFRIPFL